jgi:hypothetical protein
MLDDRTFGGILSETRIEGLIEKLIGSKIEGIQDDLRKLRSNSQKVSDGGNKKQGISNGQAQSFLFILMMESFDMFQLAGSFPSADFQLLTVFGILETKSRR